MGHHAEGMAVRISSSGRTAQESNVGPSVEGREVVLRYEAGVDTNSQDKPHLLATYGLDWVQKVLQFQAPWRLCARLPTRWFSGRFAGAGVSMDWTGAPLLAELSLLVRLVRKCSHSRNELWQRSQARCQPPSGWNLASSSRRTWVAECCQQ